MLDVLLKMTKVLARSTNHQELINNPNYGGTDISIIDFIQVIEQEQDTYVEIYSFLAGE
ncbi:hypothetical protein [Brunnivagina elsteri]|uniref:hypothetical protein n=1 Tax=Brunnivagina elsteri TaxID=1247191 RepID=UPI00130413BE|nr:hypothetical protein [Calothrix elsteri]